MKEHNEGFVGVDVAKLRNAIAVAAAGRDEEVRFIGEVDASPESMKKVAARLATKFERLHFCYEAGPTGYGLYRQLTALGHRCTVVAPSLIPRKPGDHVKTKRRDAVSLARLLRAGELTPVPPSLRGRNSCSRRAAWSCVIGVPRRVDSSATS